MELNCVEDLSDGDSEERGIGLGFAFVRGGGGGVAEDEGLRRIGAVADGIRRAEDGDGFCAEGDGQVKRTGVAADNALCAFKQSHERAEFAVVEKWIGVAAGGFYGGGESFFAGPIVNYTGQI